MALITKLNNIANAIAAKTGQPASSYTIDNMPTAIASIQTDFPVVPDTTSKTVRFIDYDGTIVTEMTLDEAHALTALPPLPTHTGLTATGWTHSLQSVTNTSLPLDVGAMYQWADNPDTTVFKIWPENGTEIRIPFEQDTTNGVEFDWGDGSAVETFAGTGALTATHSYTSVTAADMPYLIKITPAAGVALILGVVNQPMITTIVSGTNRPQYLGMKVLFGRCEVTGTLNGYNSLTSVLFSQNATAANINNFFSGDLALRYAIIPQNVGALFAQQTFYGCLSLEKVVLPEETVSTNNYYAFQNCQSLDRIVMPAGMTGLSNSLLYGTTSLREFVYDTSTITTFGTQLYYNSGIKTIIVPATLTSASNSSLSNTVSVDTIKFEDRSAFGASLQSGWLGLASQTLRTLDFSDFTQVPTFQNATVASNFFYGLRSNTIIKVPSSLLTSWKAATYWSDYASQIVGV